MKNLCIYIILCFLYSFVTKASETKQYKISYNENEFSFYTEKNGDLSIQYNKPYKSFYPEKEVPALPFIPIEIAISENMDYQDYNFSVKKRLLKSDVSIGLSVPPIPNNGTKSNTFTSSEQIITSTFPETVCEYISSSHLNGVTILHFMTSPFIYDAEEKKLYFIDEVSVEIHVKDNKGEAIKKSKSDINMVKNIVFNPNDLNAFSNVSSYNPDKIDYVIITSNALKPVFERLLKWKKIKGVRSKIITIEEISLAYPEGDLQYKIKTCLYHLWKDFGLSYALIGGDDSIVPVRYCYSEVRDYIDSSIPSDLYYACFDGSFDWDDNGNGVYGELDDKINFAASISVTRIPTRNSSDTELVIDKLIRYEQKPSFNNRMLLTGVQTHYFDTRYSLSDVTVDGQRMIDNYIKPYWEGEVIRLYDSLSDFNENGDYDVTAANLKSQLDNGYSFIEMNTHGSQTSWAMERGGSYSTSHALSQNCNVNAIVVTDACFTNAFDTKYSYTADPCLSEAFLRNSSSGVVAYLGSSRYGWGAGGQTNQLLYSPLVSARFFKNLFDTNNQIKNFGDVVKMTKLSLISSSSSYDAYRWLQYSLNPIGDPEMPIFTDVPNIFNSLFVNTDEALTIDTGEENTKVCVSSKNDDGFSYYNVYEDSSSLSLTDFPMECNVCVTKQGYIPKLFSFSLIQNEIVSGKRHYSSDIIKIGNNVTSARPSGNVLIDAEEITLDAPVVIIGKGTTIAKGTSLKVINTKK